MAHIASEKHVHSAHDHSLTYLRSTHSQSELFTLSHFAPINAFLITRRMRRRPSNLQNPNPVHPHNSTARVHIEPFCMRRFGRRRVHRTRVAACRQHVAGGTQRRRRRNVRTAHVTPAQNACATHFTTSRSFCPSSMARGRQRRDTRSPR